MSLGKVGYKGKSTATTRARDDVLRLMRLFSLRLDHEGFVQPMLTQFEGFPKAGKGGPTFTSKISVLVLALHEVSSKAATSLAQFSSVSDPSYADNRYRVKAELGWTHRYFPPGKAPHGAQPERCQYGNAGAPISALASARPSPRGPEQASQRHGVGDGPCGEPRDPAPHRTNADTTTCADDGVDVAIVPDSSSLAQPSGVSVPAFHFASRATRVRVLDLLAVQICTALRAHKLSGTAFKVDQLAPADPVGEVSKPVAPMGGGIRKAAHMKLGDVAMLFEQDSHGGFKLLHFARALGYKNAGALLEEERFQKCLFKVVDDKNQMHVVSKVHRVSNGKARKAAPAWASSGPAWCPCQNSLHADHKLSSDARQKLFESIQNVAAYGAKIMQAPYDASVCGRCIESAALGKPEPKSAAVPVSVQVREELSLGVSPSSAPPHPRASTDVIFTPPRSKIRVSHLRGTPTSQEHAASRTPQPGPLVTPTQDCAELSAVATEKAIKPSSSDEAPDWHAPSDPSVAPQPLKRRSLARSFEAAIMPPTSEASTPSTKVEPFIQALSKPLAIPLGPELLQNGSANLVSALSRITLPGPESDDFWVAYTAHLEDDLVESATGGPRFTSLPTLPLHPANGVHAIAKQSQHQCVAPEVGAMGITYRCMAGCCPRGTADTPYPPPCATPMAVQPCTPYPFQPEHSFWQREAPPEPPPRPLYAVPFHPPWALGPRGGAWQRYR